ncbi:hypothetical protein [Streptacidiphilus fuscans]|uniref:Uncharacterized protein n=1 Tax=Streptacidiphilus fuscans TaxID=2789292 RepID=A0A931BA68_9ACTN|nr:hypothetical protein [Streptacidiphilus fuscans]MBF9071866.1 hypothetical protein [Streptacidiphilus fuscans]
MSDTMRAIVITESLIDGRLPEGLDKLEDRRYPHMLDERTPIEIIELTIPADRTADVGMQLAEALKPKLYYAHLLGEDHMLVAFPCVLARIDRDDPAATALAQTIGAQFDIPAEQMRFQEMFDEDHPDAPNSTTPESGTSR